MSPAPTGAHQHVVAMLLTILLQHVREHDLGRCLPAPFDVVLSDDTVVQPDIVFVRSERFESLYDGHGLRGAPDLVVEVLSPGTARLDRTAKRELYRHAGVPWLVLIEPGARLAEVFELTDDGAHSQLAAAVAENDTLELGLFPGLQIALGELWLDATTAEEDTST